MAAIGAALKEIGYELRIYSLKDGPGQLKVRPRLKEYFMARTLGFGSNNLSEKVEIILVA